MNFKAGDVIIFDSDGSWWDKFIHIVSPRTHTGNFVNNTQYSEAGAKGVVLTDYDPSRAPHRVYSMPEKYADRIPDMLELVDMHLGDKYSVPQAAMAGLLRILGLSYLAEKIDRNWFCVEWSGFLNRFGLRMKFFEGMAVRALVPSDLEKAVIQDGWVRIK